MNKEEKIEHVMNCVCNEYSRIFSDSFNADMVGTNAREKLTYMLQKVVMLETMIDTVLQTDFTKIPDNEFEVIFNASNGEYQPRAS